MTKGEKSPEGSYWGQPSWLHEVSSWPLLDVSASDFVNTFGSFLPRPPEASPRFVSPEMRDEGLIRISYKAITLGGKSSNILWDQDHPFVTKASWPCDSIPGSDPQGCGIESREEDTGT